MVLIELQFKNGCESSFNQEKERPEAILMIKIIKINYWFKKNRSTHIKGKIQVNKVLLIGGDDFSRADLDF